jgi:hypothetical protein
LNACRMRAGAMRRVVGSRYRLQSILASINSRPGCECVGRDEYSKTLCGRRAVLGGIDLLTSQRTVPSCCARPPCPVGVALATPLPQPLKHTAEKPCCLSASLSCRPLIWCPDGHRPTSLGLTELPPPQAARRNTAKKTTAGVAERTCIVGVSTRVRLPFTRLGQCSGMTPEPRGQAGFPLTRAPA